MKTACRFNANVVGTQVSAAVQQLNDMSPSGLVGLTISGRVSEGWDDEKGQKGNLIIRVSATVETQVSIAPITDQMD